MNNNISYEITKRYLKDELGISIDDVIVQNITDNSEMNEYSNTTQLVKDINVPNMHELMILDKELSLITKQAWTTSIHHVLTDNKLRITISGDIISMKMNEKGKVLFHLSGTEIRGNKKLSVIKYMLTFGWVNHWSDNGWNVFTILWNGREYNVGYMDDNLNACFMSRAKTPTDKEYYQQYYNQTSSGWRRPYTATLEDEVYGDAASSMGYVFSGEVEQQLQEALELIQSVSSDTMYSETLDAISAILQNH